MGTVWLARDHVLDREVAIKELRIPGGLSPAEHTELIQRIMREAEVTARIRHPSVVSVHDILIEGGKPWIVMERLRGRTLADEIIHRGPLPAQWVAEVGARLLEALSAAHALGIQHRDVKPSNVFLTDDGHVLLTDFGIARPADLPTLTQTGMLIGSLGFISPERLEGAPGGAASDLWSLGATLYVAAEGEPPYSGTEADVVRSTLTQEPRPPRLAGPLEPLLRWMLARDPASRPDAMTTLGMLQQLAAGVTPVVPAVLPARRTQGRNRWPTVLAGVVAAAIAAGAVFALFPASAAERGQPKKASPRFDKPVDLCALVPASLLSRLIAAPVPKPKANEEKHDCQWAIKDLAVAVTAEKDDATATPWAQTPESARQLFQGIQRYYHNGPVNGSWTWPEIGLQIGLESVASRPRPLAGVGDEAFVVDLATPDGKLWDSIIYLRYGDLVLRPEYGGFKGATPDQIRKGAEDLARAVDAALRRLG